MTTDQAMHTPIDQIAGTEIPSDYRQQKLIEVSDLPHTVLVISQGPGARNLICSNHAYRNTPLIY